LRVRRDALARALRLQLGADCLPRLPAGGLHLWVALPRAVSDIDVEQRAAARGILVSAGRHWHPAEPAAPFLRLSFAAAQPDWIGACVADLAQVVRDAGGSPARGALESV
jgi:DNA-binding transcriptional MocR family regulator